MLGVTGLIGLWYLQDRWRVLAEPRLDPAPAPPASAPSPTIAVIIPARNEAGRIGACLAGLAAQSYTRFTVVVVDDHSQDSTAAVVASFATRLPQLTLVRGAELPQGWSGKCWACWQGVERSGGELLLFLDADVVPQPQLLAAIAARASERQLAMLTLLPLVELRTLAERLVLPVFFTLLSTIYSFATVNDPRSPLAFAIGQCIMLRREVYAALGGHRAVRASVLEDMELARLVKGARQRCEAAAAPDLLAVRMYSGWGALVEGLGKNAVAGFRNSGRRSALAGVRLLVMAVAPIYLALGAALLHGAAAQLALGCLGALLLLALGCWGEIIARRHRAARLWALTAPLGAALYFAIALRALYRIRSGRGVSWKGRTFGG